MDLQLDEYLSNWDMSKAKYFSGRTDSDGNSTENGAEIFSNACTSLTTIITPKAYSNVERVKIILPGTFKTRSEETYSELKSGSPTQTELRKN